MKILKKAKVSLLIFFVLGWLISPASIAQDSLENGIAQLVEQIAQQMKEHQIAKIAIDDFTDLNGYKSALGDFISEELVTSFYTQSVSTFDVVERRELARVLKEQELGSTGLLNKESIAKIGELLGIDAIVTGSIAYLGDTIKVNARMIGVENAKVFAAASKKITKDSTVEVLMNQSSRTANSSGNIGLGNSRSGIQVQRYDVGFQNSFCSVTPASASISQDKTQATIALKFQNVLGESIFIAIQSSDDIFWRPETSLISDSGERLGIEEISGLEVLLTHYSKINENTSYTEIDAGTETTVVFVFKTNIPIEGNFLSFSANLYRLQNDKYKKFSVGISNIEINKPEFKS